MAITQLHPQHATGRRYGSFAGRGGAASAHPVGVLTQLRPQRATGGRYGSFAGRGAGGGGTHPVGPITQLHPQHATGRRYGSFAGRVSGVEPPEPPVVIPGTGTGGGFFTRQRPSPPTQYARLHPFEDLDQFNLLLARPGIARAYLRPYAETDLYARLQAAAIAYAAIKPVDHTDEYAQVIAQRGLPSKALLAFLMSEFYKH